MKPHVTPITPGSGLMTPLLARNGRTLLGLRRVDGAAALSAIDLDSGATRWHVALQSWPTLCLHERAVEAGDWATAEAQLDPGFTMQMKGMPFFKKIPFADALLMHKARKRAFPDFSFNEKVESAEGNAVRVAVFLKGTHTGFLDYPISEVPKLEATGRPIDLPAEYFTYFFENDRITHIYGEIPEGHGPPALKKQLGVQ